MSFAIDSDGFLTTIEYAAELITIAPPENYTLPRWVNGVWTEGIVRRAHVMDEFGFYLRTEPELDPRTTNLFTTVFIPESLVLPQFHNGHWVEGSLNYVAKIDTQGFFVTTLKNFDPRNLDEFHVLAFPPVEFIVPRFVDGAWIDIGLKAVAVIDADGYLMGFAENIDPRYFDKPFTTVLPEGNFLVPRLVDGQWTEAGIRHAWKLDAEGYFIHDLHNFDPRAIEDNYTTVPLDSGKFRKPRFVNGGWIEANPITDEEIFVQSKLQKLTEIEQMQFEALTGGVPYRFGEVDDVIQTRHERDLINISGVTTRAMLLQSQGINDPVIQFRAQSNTTYLLTPDEAILLGQAVALHSEEIYTKGWNLKDALSLADTLEDIEALTW